MGMGNLGSNEIAVRDAITMLAADRSLPRSATKLAELAGVGRATLYRIFTARPELRDSFDRLVEQSPSRERSELERSLAERVAEIHLLKDRLAALSSTVEHLVRDNDALRASLAQHRSAVALADISKAGRRRPSATAAST
jgi:hypothetical protein